jgi:hypothetical protein
VLEEELSTKHVSLESDSARSLAKLKWASTTFPAAKLGPGQHTDAAEQKDKEDLEELSTELELADEDELVPYVPPSLFLLLLCANLSILSSSLCHPLCSLIYSFPLIFSSP